MTAMPIEKKPNAQLRRIALDPAPTSPGKKVTLNAKVTIFLRKQDRWILYFLWHNTHFNNNQYVITAIIYCYLWTDEKILEKRKRRIKYSAFIESATGTGQRSTPSFHILRKKYAFVEPALKLLVVFAHALKRCCRRISFHTVSFWAKTYFPTIRYCIGLRGSPSILYF